MPYPLPSLVSGKPRFSCNFN